MLSLEDKLVKASERIDELVNQEEDDEEEQEGEEDQDDEEELNKISEDMSRIVE